jgi:predicted extracellular nuclease
MRNLRSLFIFCAFVALWSPPSSRTRAASDFDIVINEFRVRGPRGGNDEFIELQNRSAAAIEIGGWTLRGSNSAGTASIRATVPGGTMLNPGCAYLFTNVATNGYSDIVAGNTTYTIGITDDGGVAIAHSDGTIIDQVGMSAGSAYKEGSPLPSLGSSNLNRSYQRIGADTNNNLADFRSTTPSVPENAGYECLGGTDPVVTAVATPNPVTLGDALLISGIVVPGTTPPSTGIAVTANLLALGGSVSQPLFDDGSNGDVAANDSIYSYRIETIAVAAGNYLVGLTAADAEGRSDTGAVTVVVQAPAALYLPHEIQGVSATSDFAGSAERVTVEGVVTGRTSNGVFLQTEAGREDGLAQTSEGLFVFTGSEAPPADVVVGALVRATGAVVEFSGDGSGQTLTELSGAPSFSIIGTGAMPGPVTLTSAHLSPSGGFGQLEHLESMLVYAPSLTTVSGTSGFFANATGGEATGVVTSNGVFYAVLGDTPRPIREAGLDLPIAATFADQCAAGTACQIPVFDSNPERLRIDSDRLGGAALDVTSGVVLSDVLGIVDTGFLTWSLLPVPNGLGSVGANAGPLPVALPSPAQFTVASFNMQRFFDTLNDPGSDVPLDPANYANRLGKASLVIRTMLNMPDVLAVQEVEKLTVLQALAARINADAGLADEYTAYLEEGNDPGGIDVGFLVRSRVRVSSVQQVGADATFEDPVDGSIDLLNDRPPLLLQATVRAPASRLDADIIVVVNHLRSLDDVESNARVRVKRQKQAEFLAVMLDDLQEQGAVISLGDYNAFEVNDGLVDVLGTVAGHPAADDRVVVSSPDLVDPDFVIGAPGVYSYVFEGNAQTLDHILMSADAAELFAGVQHARINADFPEVYRQDPSRVERLSDHDPAVAFFDFPLDTVPPAVSASANVLTIWPPDHKFTDVAILVDATDNVGIGSCSIASVSSSDHVNGRGDGNTEPDWIIDGPTALRLRAERSGGKAERVYSVLVQCTDVAGNVGSSTVDIRVAGNGLRK